MMHLEKERNGERTTTKTFCGEPPIWHLEDAIRMLCKWFEIGDLDLTQKCIFTRRNRFQLSSSRVHKIVYAAIEMVVATAEEFEREHGEGSFLNTEHPYVQSKIRGDGLPLQAHRIANALKARDQRDVLMNQILSAPFGMLFLPETWSHRDISR